MTSFSWMIMTNCGGDNAKICIFWISAPFLQKLKYIFNIKLFSYFTFVIINHIRMKEPSHMNQAAHTAHLHNHTETPEHSYSYQDPCGF